MRRSGPIPPWLALGVAMSAASLHGRADPSPSDPVDVDQLLRLARVHAAQGAELYYTYTYRQRTTVETLAADGSVRRKEVRVHRVVPSPEGTELHLLELDGAPPTAAEVRKREKRNAAIKRRWARMEAREQRERQERAIRTSPPRKDGTAAPTQAAASPVVSVPSPPATAPASRKPSPPADTKKPEVPLTDPSIPPCDPVQPAATVRPPPPGSKVRSSRRPPQDPSSRRGRQSTSDYTIFELLSLTDYAYAGTCRLGHRPVHVLSFEPPPEFDPANPVERVVMAMAGTILIDAEELEIVRAEGRTVAPIRWGAGLVALRSGHVVFENAKVNDEAWLPSRSLFDFDSRVMFDTDRQVVTHVFDDFKKAVVTSQAEFGGIVEDESPPPSR